MPQVVSGQTGYLGGETGGQGNGVGAVIFDAPSVNRANAGNMLFQALSSRAKQLDDAGIQKQKAIQAQSFGMLDGIDIDKQGVFEPDLPYFQEKTKELIDRRGQIYAKYGGDLTSKQALQDINALDGEKAKLKLEALQSASDKKVYSDAMGKFINNPSKYHPQLSTKGLDDFKSAKLGERGGVQTLHEAPPILMDIMDKHSKTIEDDTEVSESYTDKNGKVLVKTTKGKSPEKIDQAYQTLYQANPDVQTLVKERYAELPESEKTAMELVKALSGKTDVPVEQMWLGRVAVNNYSSKNKGVKSLGNNMYEQDRLMKGRMAYGQQLRNEAQESLFVETLSAYANGDSPDMSVEIMRETPNGLQKATYNPSNIYGGTFDIDASHKGIKNTVLGTIVMPMKINGKDVKVIKKVDTKSLLKMGAINEDDLLSGDNMANLVSSKDMQKVIMDNAMSLPDYTSSDVITLARINGVSDKAITATAKKWRANTGGGIFDVGKINQKTEATQRTVGELKPKITETKVEVKPKPTTQTKKEVQKEKVVNGVKMPYNATPKYSKQTGKLMGYELPDGTKYKL